MVRAAWTAALVGATSAVVHIATAQFRPREAPPAESASARLATSPAAGASAPLSSAEPDGARRPPSEPARPRATVLATAAEGVDSFVPIWLGEVGATLLRNAGRRVVTAERAAEALTAATSARPRAEALLACARDPHCASDVAVRLGAPELVFIDVALQSAGILRTRVVAVEVAEEARVVGETEVAGSETDGAVGVRDVVAALAARPAPCAVVVDLPPGGEARIARGVGEGDGEASHHVPDGATAGGREPRSGTAGGGTTEHGAAGRGTAGGGAREGLGSHLEPLPPFVRAGEHPLEVRVPGRAPWRGTLRCESGRRLAVRAR